MPLLLQQAVMATGRNEKNIGTFRTRKEAQEYLSEFYKNPYDLSGITFKDVYDLWYKTKRFSASTERSYSVALKRCSNLWDMPIANIRLKHLKDTLDRTNCSAQSRYHMKIICVQVFDYALRNELVQKNYAKLLDTIAREEVKKAGVPFTVEEEQALWNDGGVIASYLLIGIYSGWRVNELLHLNIEDGLMKGGSKTKAGKNRIVPVHSKIEPLIDSYKQWEWSYPSFVKKFNKLMGKPGFNHTPKDTRHTFATRCAEAGVDDKVRKILIS